MEQDGVGGAEDLGLEQARLVRRAMDRTGLHLHEVWLHYFSIGGNAGEVEVDAFLHHALPLPPLERDTLAHAVNELIDSRRVQYVPYTWDLTEEDQAAGPEEPAVDDSDEGAASG